MSWLKLQKADFNGSNCERLLKKKNCTSSFEMNTVFQIRDDINGALDGFQNIANILFTSIILSATYPI